MTLQGHGSMVGGTVNDMPLPTRLGGGLMGWFSPSPFDWSNLATNYVGAQMVFKTVPPLREGGLLPSGRCEPMAGGIRDPG